VDHHCANTITPPSGTLLQVEQPAGAAADEYGM
jgi:hypothetical protein